MSTSEDLLNELGMYLIGVDRPSYGLSSMHKKRTFQSFTKDVVSLADDLGLKKFFVVGVSGGGPYALATAYYQRERVRGVMTLSMPYQQRKCAHMHWPDPPLPLRESRSYLVHAVWCSLVIKVSLHVHHERCIYVLAGCLNRQERKEVEEHDKRQSGRAVRRIFKLHPVFLHLLSRLSETHLGGRFLYDRILKRLAGGPCGGLQWPMASVM